MEGFNCPKCSREILNTSSTCIYCGYQFSSKKKENTKNIGGLYIKLSDIEKKVVECFYISFVNDMAIEFYGKSYFNRDHYNETEICKVTKLNKDIFQDNEPEKYVFLNNFMFNESFTYKVWGKYLIESNSHFDFNGFIPNEPFFETICTNELMTIKFKKDGTFSVTYEHEESLYNGKYHRNEELLKLIYSDSSIEYYLIYDNILAQEGVFIKSDIAFLIQNKNKDKEFINKIKTQDSDINMLKNLNGKKYVSLCNTDNYLEFTEDVVYEYTFYSNGKSYENKYTISDNVLKYSFYNYIIWGDYILYKTLEDCNSPKENKFELTILGYAQKYVFKKDGSVTWYEYDDEKQTITTDISTGTYKRSEELVRLNLYSKMSKKGFVNYLVFTDDKVYDAAYLISSRVSKLDFVYHNSSLENNTNSNIYNSTGNSNSPWDIKYYNYPCPYCGKYKVRNAGWNDKKFSLAFWGIFSYKVQSNYKCDACKKMWE